MFVLAGEAPVGEQVVGADHHHVDAVDRDDLVGLGHRFVAFELHHQERRGVERGIGLGGRETAIMQVRQRPRGRALAERREFRRFDVIAGFGGRADMRRDDAERAAVEHPRYLGVPGTRTSGVMPAASAAMQIWPVVSSEKLECSIST